MFATIYPLKRALPVTNDDRFILGDSIVIEIHLNREVNNNGYDCLAKCFVYTYHSNRTTLIV